MDWLHSIAVTVLGVDVSWLEVLGDLTGLVSVWWAARERVGTWPVGIVNSALFLALFVDARLYASAALQVAFVALGAYGWRTWVAGRRAGAGDAEAGAGGRNRTVAELPVRRTTAREWALLAVLTVMAQAVWTTWLATRTDSVAPFWDSATLVLSLLATYGQARKQVESWFVWIAVDLVSVPLYLSQGLAPTALLFGFFGLLCLVGLRDWTRSLRTAREVRAVLAPEPA